MRVVLLSLLVSAVAAGSGAAQEGGREIAGVAISHDGASVAMVLGGDDPALVLESTDAADATATRIPLQELGLSRRFRIASGRASPRAIEEERRFGHVTWLNESSLLLDVWSSARIIRSGETGDFRRSIILSSDGEQLGQWPAAQRLALPVPGDRERVLIREGRMLGGFSRLSADNLSPSGEGLINDAGALSSYGLTFNLYENLHWLELPEDRAARDRWPQYQMPAGVSGQGELEVSYQDSGYRVFLYTSGEREIFTLSAGMLWDPDPEPDEHTTQWSVHRQPIAGLRADGTAIPFAGSDRDGEIVVRQIDIASGEISDLGWTGEDSAFGGFLIDWRTGRVIGLEWREPEIVRAYFDEDFAALQARVEALLPGDRVDLWDWDQTLSRMVIRATSDDESSQWYLFDTHSGELKPLS